MNKGQQLLSIVKKNDTYQVKRFLNNHPEVDISSLTDNKACSLLHLASHNNNYEIVEIFLDAYDGKYKDEDEYGHIRKQRWLNQKDFDGFSCLHYAVFRGNYKMAILLEHHGSDIYQINSLGLCVMHISAQGDSPLLLFYYMNKGFKIQVEDSKGSTPLHWACYSGSQSAVNALISWGAEIDCQDKIYGLTPLHLAVLSGNGRVVRKLLIRGVNRNIRDYREKLPLDLAEENEYDNIATMIKDKYGCAQFYNLKQPYRKTSKYSGPFVTLILLFLFTFLLNCVFVARHMSAPLNIAYIVLAILTIVILLIASCSSPGYLKNKNTSQGALYEMMQKNEPHLICFDCYIIKPKRSRHCQVCNSCIMVYDHHCPWINNCVGAKNYAAFFLFIFTMELFLTYSVAYEIYALQERVSWDNLTPMTILHISTACLTLLLAILFSIPLFVLLCVQTANCTKDETTYERYTGGRLTVTDSSQKESEELENVDNDRINKSSNEPVMPTSSNSSLSIEDPLISKGFQPESKPLCKSCWDMCCFNKYNSQYMV